MHAFTHCISQTTKAAPPLRKLISTLLIVVYIFPFWGIYSILQYQKHQIRAEVKKAIKMGLLEEELMTLTFKASETDSLLHWRHSKEFEYDGELYDIVDFTQHGDSIAYLVYWDYAETKIKRKLDRLTTDIANKIIHSRDAADISFLDITNLYFFDGAFKAFLIPESGSGLSSYLNRIYTDNINTPVTPPPRA